MHVVESLDVGGLERVVLELAHWQRRHVAEGGSVSIACLFHEGALATQARARGLLVSAVGKRRGPDPVALWRLRRMLAAVPGSGPLLVHTHNPMAHVYTSAATVGLPLAALVNTRHGMGSARPQARQERLYRTAMRRADAAVAVCEAARTHFVSQGIFAEGRRTDVVPNGIELGEADEGPISGWPSRATDRLGLRSTLGCGADELLIGTVGRLAAVKNHAGLLDAVAAVRRSGRPVRLVLAGDGACRASLELQAMAPDLAGAVHFLGWRSDVWHVMRAIDVFALSSSAEGWPLVLLEAAAAGTPCVATAVGGVPEMVSAGGLGLLVPAGDSQAMATALIGLLDAPVRRAEIGSAAQRWAHAHGSVDAMGRRYEALYESLTARRSHNPHPRHGAS